MTMMGVSSPSNDILGSRRRCPCSGPQQVRATAGRATLSGDGHSAAAARQGQERSPTGTPPERRRWGIFPDRGGPRMGRFPRCEVFERGGASLGARRVEDVGVYEDITGATFQEEQ